MDAIFPFFDVAPAGDSPRVETLEFRTALAIARDGTEQRIATRALPRYSLSATYYLTSLAHPALQRLRAGGAVLIPQHHLRDPLTREIPAFQMLLSSDYSSSSRTHHVHSVQLQFDAVNPLPLALLGGLEGPTSPSVAPKFFAHNWASGLKGLLATDADVFDAGHVRERVQRYQKHGWQIEVSLISREQIDGLRAFFCSLRGATGEFVWTSPGDGQPRRWRLGSDTLSINHVTNSYATASVAVYYVGEVE